MKNNYILINKHSNNNVNVACKNVFFKDEVCIKILHDKLEITKPHIDSKQIRKTYFTVKKWWQFTINIINKEVPLGKFYFDAEESNEDTLVIYFN